MKFSILYYRYHLLLLNSWKVFSNSYLFYNCSIIRSIVLCWVSQQIYSKPILEFIEFVACSIFCSSRSLNSLFCCINLVKKLQKLTKDFNDRLRSRKSFFFLILNLNTLQQLGCISRVCLDTFKINTVHLIDCGFNKRKLHLISSFIIQIWSRRMELRHQRDQESFRRKALKYWQLSLELTLTLKSHEISWNIRTLFFKQHIVFDILTNC